MMKLTLKQTLFLLLTVSLLSCADESEDLTLKEIVHQKLIQSGWSVELYPRNNSEQTINTEDYKVTFHSDQKINLTNGSSTKGIWNLQYNSDIDHYDELNNEYIDYNDSIVWDDANEKELLLQVILSQKDFTQLTGYWTINSYDNNSIILENESYILKLQEKTNSN